MMHLKILLQYKNLLCFSLDATIEVEKGRSLKLIKESLGWAVPITHFENEKKERKTKKNLTPISFHGRAE